MRTKPKRPLASVTREQRRDFAAAHAEGLHVEIPREFCPECEAEGTTTRGTQARRVVTFVPGAVAS